MAGRKRSPARVASSSRSCSVSSRNFRNMIQVSIGSRSRSPLRPLSLRMMSRADLTMLASRWDVVTCGDGRLLLRPRLTRVAASSSNRGRVGSILRMVTTTISSPRLPMRNRYQWFSGGIQQRLQLIYCAPELLGTTKLPRDLDHVATLGDRRDLERVGQDELRSPVLGVLVEKFAQDGFCLLPVAIEEVGVLPAKPIRTFATCTQRG